MQLDNKRGNYLLKETSLAKALCVACGVDLKTIEGQAAMKYKEGRNAGFFARTMREVRQAFGVALRQWRVFTAWAARTRVGRQLLI